MKKLSLIGFLVGTLTSGLWAGPDPRGVLELEGYGYNGAVGVKACKGRGDFTIKEPLASGDSIFFTKGYGWDGVKFSTNPVASMDFLANETFTTTANGGKIVFKVNPVTTLTPTTIMTIDGTGVTIVGALTATTMGANLGVLVATQTIAAAGTVAADACGSIKRISSAGVVTSSTTTTFTAPSASNAMCVMDVCNVGSNNITLDNNAGFKSIGGADIVLTPDDCTRVGQVGGYWTSLGGLVAN